VVKPRGVNQLLKSQGFNPDGSPIPGFKNKELSPAPATVSDTGNEAPTEGPEPLPITPSKPAEVPQVDLIKNPDIYRKKFITFPKAVKSKYLEDVIPAGGQVPDILRWVMQYLPYTIEKPYSRFHLTMYDMLASQDRILVAAFRGSAKSRVLQKYVVWALCNFCWKNIIILSKTAEISSQFLAKVRSDLKNSKPIYDTYKSVIFPLQQDNNELLQIATGAMVSAKGKDYQIRGHQSLYGRPDLVIFDDPETTLDVKSDTARMNLETYFDQDLLKALNTERSQVVILGNIFDRLCFVKKIADNKDNKYHDFKVYAPPAESKDSEGGRRSLWPSLWPIERLDQERLRGYLAYQREFMNNPVDSEFSLFKEDWIKYYDRMPTDSGFDKFIVVDPAGFSETGTNKNRDYTGICILYRLKAAKPEDEKFYVWYWKRMRKTPLSVAEHVINLYLDYRPAHIVIEKHGVITLGGYLQEQAERRGLILSGVIKNVTHSNKTGDLRQRTEQVLGLFEYGKVFFRPDHKELVYDEILPFPNADHDDAVSVLEMGLTYAKKNRWSSTTPPITNPLFVAWGNRKALVPDSITGRPK